MLDKAASNRGDWRSVGDLWPGSGRLSSRFDDDDNDNTLDLGMRFIEYEKCSCQMMSKRCLSLKLVRKENV